MSDLLRGMDIGLGPSVGGLFIIYNPMATQPDGLWFPYSRNRSSRVFKKLLRRYGGQEKRKPAIYRLGNKIVAHPAFRAELEKVMKP